MSTTPRLSSLALILATTLLPNGAMAQTAQPDSDGRAPAAATEAARAPTTVAQWRRFEASFVSAKTYENPVQEVELSVDFTGPNGAARTVAGFWDGGTTFRVRFSPDAPGAWTYRTRSSDVKNAGLHDRSGAFTCIAASGKNALFAHGPVRVSSDRRFLQHADGAPFFWLADTAWAGPMLAADAEWATFLRDRANKRFNVVQVMATQNIAAAGDANGRQAFAGKDKIAIDPVFWRRLDARFDSANEAGLVVSPSFSWAAAWAPAGVDMDPGHVLPEPQLIKLLQYALARYGAHHVVWLHGGDIDYSGPAAEKWKRVGRAVYGEKPAHVVSMHPAPRRLHFVDFKGEPWLGFLGYQSSHSNSERTHRYITEGEPATVWKQEPVYPVINIEPNYEKHFDFGNKDLMDAYDVRRQAYWSVLVSPTAGVSYGAHGLWSWEHAPNVPMSHPLTGVARPWNEALKYPGSAHMKILVDVFTAKARPWWRLRPVPERVIEQPGKMDHNAFVAAAATEDQQLLVAYFPTASSAALNLSGWPKSARASWLDPASGRARPAAGFVPGDRVVVTPPGKNATGDSDFVFVVDGETRANSQGSARPAETK